VSVWENAVPVTIELRLDWDIAGVDSTTDPLNAWSPVVTELVARIVKL
jgi:hypothetical protein